MTIIWRISSNNNAFLSCKPQWKLPTMTMRWRINHDNNTLPYYARQQQQEVKVKAFHSLMLSVNMLLNFRIKFALSHKFAFFCTGTLDLSNHTNAEQKLSFRLCWQVFWSSWATTSGRPLVPDRKICVKSLFQEHKVTLSVKPDVNDNSIVFPTFYQLSYRRCVIWIKCYK